MNVKIKPCDDHFEKTRHLSEIIEIEFMKSNEKVVNCVNKENNSNLNFFVDFTGYRLLAVSSGVLLSNALSRRVRVWL